MPGQLYDATCGRLFARLYDRILRGAERGGLAVQRAELLSRAHGRTIELGAGTGLNLAHYTDAVSELVLTEPFGPMATQLRARLAADGRSAEVIEAPAESLPVADSSFDTVVMTLVLCTIPDPAAALSEVERILNPHGEVLFLEHVRSSDPRAARWQDRLHRPWRAIAHGCNCNRDTLAEIEATGLEVGDVEHGELPSSPAFLRPTIVGSATASAPTG